MWVMAKRRASKARRFRRYRVAAVVYNAHINTVKTLIIHESLYFDKQQCAWRYKLFIGKLPMSGWEQAGVMALAIRKPLDLL
jgi:hypothetical protein